MFFIPIVNVSLRYGEESSIIWDKVDLLGTKYLAHIIVCQSKVRLCDLCIETHPINMFKSPSIMKNIIHSYTLAYIYSFEKEYVLGRCPPNSALRIYIHIYTYIRTYYDILEKLFLIL